MQQETNVSDWDVTKYINLEVEQVTDACSVFRTKLVCS